MTWAGQQGLIDYRPMQTPRDVYELYRKLGITHILYLPNEREAPSKQEDALFNTFVRRYGVGAKHFAPYELVEMPKTPPPEEAPWKALSVSVAGYRDGVYPIEAMGTFDALPDVVRTYAAPSREVSHADIDEAIREVDVVFAGKSATDVASKLTGEFDSVATYGALTIYVRKGR
jgi:hypothetical protein